MTTTLTAPTDRQRFLDAFAQLEAEAPAHRRLRQAGIARFDALGFPGPRNEDWKFTSLAPLLRVPFQPARSADLDLGPFRDHPGLTAPARLVFVRGQYRPDLSALPAGVTAGPLSAHAQRAEEHLGRHARFDDQAFTALNTALFRDGVFVSVAAGAIVEQPIHLVFVNSAEGDRPVMAYPRNLVVAGPNSQVTLVESHLGAGETPTFSCIVGEVVVGAGANVDHYKVQEEGPAGFHLANLQAVLQRASRFSTHFVGLGGQWARNEVRVRFEDEGGEATVNGLYLAAGTQHMDNHTVIDHARAHCASHELYKGILDGKARGVFNGKIFVAKHAQKTDAKQTNQTLLLSEDATIDTKPQLEIYADDVKCTHGATVGQLADEQLFYLRTRGVGLAEARAVLTFAFANDIIRRVRVAPVRQRLEATFLAKRNLPAFDDLALSEESR